MRICSTSLITTKMQIKSGMRYHITPVRMANIYKTRDSKCSHGCGEKGSIVHCWYTATTENSMELLQKQK